MTPRKWLALVLAVAALACCGGIVARDYFNNHDPREAIEIQGFWAAVDGMSLELLVGHGENHREFKAAVTESGDQITIEVTAVRETGMSHDILLIRRLAIKLAAPLSSRKVVVKATGQELPALAPDHFHRSAGFITTS